MSDMTPERARELIDQMEVYDDAQLSREYALDALATLAAMRVEHDHGVVDWETVDGRYEVYLLVRLVSDWGDA